VKLAAVIIAKARSRRESEWRGLSENEARAKIGDRLPARIPEDKRDMITDKVVTKMRDRGVLREEAEDTDQSSVDLTQSEVRATETADT
jgi:hypothetical protein